ANEENEMVENVAVSPATGMDVAFTNAEGIYTMNLPTEENYVITPEKDDDLLNGVSTYDLVLMSRHILEIELLDSPYKIIAADVNNSGDKPTTFDIVELRKVILFINDEFPDNTSWRFIDADYVFPNPANPFEQVFPESYPINGLTGDMADLDFVAVKIGDVNGSAQTNGFASDAEGRDFTGRLDLNVEDIQLSEGESRFVEVKAGDFQNIMGYQFTMTFEGVEVLDVIPGVLPSMAIDNFGLQHLPQGMLTCSWNSVEALSLSPETVLFTLELKAKRDLLVSDALRISSQLTAAEAYAEELGNIGLKEVHFVFRNGDQVLNEDSFELYQNRPNPFKDETIIAFDLPQKGEAALTVYDLSGRILTKVSKTFDKGYNEVSIQKADLSGAGVFYYELSTPQHTAIRKMTLIE
ncbi:MAG TPA: T9SS type A sorting domain-containing protein, partial [Phaeodactylibacter sp.]|nr:T9SS type A sorting domain-containing protein [Phaeodactylibacter sp.]